MTSDLLPNIRVTLNQVKATSASARVPINATVVLKALTGPIGELTRIGSYTEAVKIFGAGDTKDPQSGTPLTPALYGVEQYLKTYNYVNIIRVANTNASDATNKAAEGTVSIETHVAAGSEPTFAGVIISGKSVYKTQMYNGQEIRLLYNTTRTRMSISGVLDGVTYTTPLEVIDLSSTTGEQLSNVLGKLVDNWNAMNTGIVLENKFQSTDTPFTVAEITATGDYGIYGKVQLGNSGLNNISNADVATLLTTVIDNPTVQVQDVVMVPEFRNQEVVNAGLALKNAYFYIVAAEGQTLAAKQTSVENYTPSDKGALYIPSGCKMGDDSITVPFEVAALYAWATTYNVNRYYAPAGVKRGTMDLVTDIVDNLTELDSEAMYNKTITNPIPANPVRYLTGYGYTIFGQKTMDADQVFTNRINVSNLVNYIYIEGNRILLPYLFEYTPISTFQKVYLDLDKMLSDLAVQEILYDDYQIICDTSNNTTETLANHELHATLAIRPINVTEYIFLDLTVTDELGGEA